MGWWQTVGLKLIHDELRSLRRLIMATQQELRDALNNLQETLDAEQEQIKTAIDGLNDTIKNMQEAEIPQDIIDQVESIRSDLASTIPEAPEPTEAAPGEPTPSEPGTPPEV